MITHTVSQTLTTGFDWTNLIGPLASALVAIVAVWISRRSSTEVIKLTKRQTDIAEAKLRADWYDRRFEAWTEIREVAAKRYALISDLKPGMNPVDAVPHEERIAFSRAADRIFFLFGEDVRSAVNDLNGALQTYHIRKSEMDAAYDPQDQNLKMVECFKADQACDEAMLALKRKVAEHMAMPIAKAD